MTTTMRLFHTDPETGLLFINWPAVRPDEIVIDGDALDALVLMINIERRMIVEIEHAAQLVCDRWRDDEIVGSSAMTREIAALRALIQKLKEEPK